MKKWAIIILSFLGVLGITSLAIYHINKYAYANKLHQTPRKSGKDSILTIAIIGDSWASVKVMDTLIHNTLLTKNISSKTISSGEGGATTKQVYQNLFKDSLEGGSSRFVLEAKPEYCIILAGINDSALQYGGHFYSYHVRLIIKTLLEHKIKPVVISLPEFGIRETTKNLGFVSRVRNRISSIINDDGATDEIKSYRETLLNDLQQEDLIKKIIYIDFDEIAKNYYSQPELYSDPSHLSRLGNAKLSAVVVREISKHWTLVYSETK